MTRPLVEELNSRFPVCRACNTRRTVLFAGGNEQPTRYAPLCSICWARRELRRTKRKAD